MDMVVGAYSLDVGELWRREREIYELDPRRPAPEANPFFQEERPGGHGGRDVHQGGRRTTRNPGDHVRSEGPKVAGTLRGIDVLDTE